MAKAVSNVKEPAIFNARLKIRIGMVVFIKCIKGDSCSVYKSKKSRNVKRLHNFLKNTPGLKLSQGPSLAPDLKNFAPVAEHKELFQQVSKRSFMVG